MNYSKLKKNIAIIFLVLMCTQYIPFEGNGVSNIKFVAMCVTPLVWLLSFKKFSRAFVLGGIFLITILFSVANNIDSFRLTTLGYKIAFISMFIMYYDLIYLNRALSLKLFIKFLKTLILAYSLVLIIQQLAIIFGFTVLPAINLTQFLDKNISANSLALEPSHASRILIVAMLILMRMNEIKHGIKNIQLKLFYKENKWVVLGFFWSILSIGSATAFVGLSILILYFLKNQYIYTILVLTIVFYFIIPHINYTPFIRAKSAFEVTLSFDADKIKEKDHSAAARIVPLINTIKSLDLYKIETWVGKGIDTNIKADYLSEEQTIGGITDYGFICFIVSLCFVYFCCIYKFWSLESLIFIILLGLNVVNVAYIWGILMLFTTSKFFKNQNEKI